MEAIGYSPKRRKTTSVQYLIGYPDPCTNDSTRRNNETRNTKSQMKVATYSKECQYTLHAHAINFHSVPDYQPILEMTPTYLSSAQPKNLSKPQFILTV